ncbi:MAG TPA: hypothetical protein VKT77_20600, partial [Chthonomonadaceae bacterium]|nr:hypothetical protein [Chthonomonadaceae bacterium]
TVDGSKASHLTLRVSSPAVASTPDEYIHAVLIAVPERNSVCYFGGAADAAHEAAMCDEVETAIRTFRFRPGGPAKHPSPSP